MYLLEISQFFSIYVKRHRRKSLMLCSFLNFRGRKYGNIRETVSIIYIQIVYTHTLTHSHKGENFE